MKQQQTNKHSNLHREDQHITVEELWKGWKTSEGKAREVGCLCPLGHSHKYPSMYSSTCSNQVEKRGGRGRQRLNDRLQILKSVAAIENPHLKTSVVKSGFGDSPYVLLRSHL